VAWIGLAACAASTLTGATAAATIWRRGVLTHVLGAWEPPLGITLVADALSALMIAMTAGVGMAVSVYACGYFARGDREHAARGDNFWPLWLGLWAALNGLFLSADLFNLYVTLELVTLAGVGLVALAGGEAVVGALRYLLWALAGSGLYLLGVALLYGQVGVLGLEQIGTRLEPSPAASAAAALLLAGLAVKGALFPLHIWLPQAHASAPPPVSAALSGLVVKASFYLVLRLGYGALAPLRVSDALEVLGWLGAAAIVWGSAAALTQRRLKLLVAYSTVAQLGYLYVALALAAPAAGVLLALAHACAKGAMFLGAGAIAHTLGHDRVGDLAGLAHRMPLTVLAFGLAGVSLMGLPPSGGFVGKWLLLQQAINAGRWGMVAVVLAGGLAAAAYVFRVVAPAFSFSDIPREPPRALEIVGLVLALAAIALGFVAPALLASLSSWEGA
jgi:multicomponent Na+:H+ antiporter subunit D